MIGIYKITNKINGKSYIGQSINIKKRWSQHKNNIGSHANPMYLDFEKYGIENFDFEVLEECEKSELNDREIYYIELYDTFNNGYNLTRGANLSNQKKFHIRKKIEKEDDCLILDWENYVVASKELSPSALNLFIYLIKNQDRKDFLLHSKDYCIIFNVTDKTYYNAKKELIKKGYLKNKTREIIEPVNERIVRLRKLF